MVDCLLCEGHGTVSNPPEISGTCPECEGTGRVMREERSRQDSDAEYLHRLLFDGVEAWKRRN